MIARVLALALRPLARLVIWLTAIAALIVGAARTYLSVYLRLFESRPHGLAVVGFNIAVVAGLAGALLLWLGLLSRLGKAGSPSGPSGSTTHGSARWGSGSHLATEHGLLLGRDRSARRRTVRYDGDAHLLTLAPTGAGKGVGCVIPNLLTYSGSVLVTDPKGENYAVTAGRRRALGQRAIAIDPFGLVAGDGSFNPLDALDADAPGAVDDAAALAELLVVREPRESGDTVFWSEEAKALLIGLILHTAATADPSRRTLATVWESLSLPPRGLTKLWTAMGQSSAAGGAVARAAARVRQKQDRVRSGILAQAQSQLHFLDSPHLARVLHHSSFSFADLKTDRVSLYLVLPPDRIDSCRRWLRLLVGCALNAVMRTRAPMGGPGFRRVLLLLDEFPALGPMPPLERAVSLARGYGATCWLLAQDLAQLQALYPRSWPTFVSNAGVVQAFGTNDVETASYLAAMLGNSTIQSASRARSVAGGPGLLAKRGDVRESWSESDHARPLLSPDEVRRLAPDTALLLMPGADPARVTRLDYRSDPAFEGTFGENPMH